MLILIAIVVLLIAGAAIFKHRAKIGSWIQALLTKVFNKKGS